MNKNKILILILILFIGFTSCKKNESELDSSLLGRWMIKTEKFKDYTNDVFTGESSDNIYNAYIEFKSDGTILNKDEDETEIGANKYIYSKSKGTITVGNVVFNVKSLTKDTLILTWEEIVTVADKVYKSIGEWYMER